MTDFSKDGRKLRPRRQAASQGRPAYSTSDRRERTERPENGEHRQYGERRSFGDNRGARNYGEHRPYGERKTYGEQKTYGERRQGEGRQYGNNDRHARPDRASRPFGERKPYGQKPAYGARRNTGSFNKASNEGINRMIAASPKAQISDFDSAPSQVKEEIRLNKFIANSGVCSRREADTMIQAGVVTVNGEVVTELGTKVNILKDVVKFNGETLRGEAKVYIVMNKPKGFVTTASDPHADKTVMDLLKNCPNRVYPVGRLDKATTGVLMFTNDGEISERLTHPSYDKKKIYQVVLNKPLTEEDRQKILAGVELSDGPIAADALEFIDPEDKRKLGIEIHSGKNRVVRRIFEAVGCEVRTLDRVYFAGLTKKGLKKGEWRYLTEGEVNILKMGAYV
ncbi:MAG: pseudouridine synthase [Bacteroidales bacterium]|nr:pseudouridine synthase [Bacteroidales bacterium]